MCLWLIILFYCFDILVVLRLVVSTSAIHCLERLVSEMTDSMSWDVKRYSLTHSLARSLANCRIVRVTCREIARNLSSVQLIVTDVNIYC